jgi:Fe-S oxidoreductase
MEALANLRRQTAAALCLACGKCATMCPLAETGDFSARRIASLGPSEDLEDCTVAVERCLTCGSCEVRCPQGVRFSDFVRGLRTLIPMEAHTPCPHAEVLQSTARLMAGETPPERDLSWVGDLKVAQEGDVALFVGCLPFFDVMFRDELGIEPLEIARSAIRLLNSQGIEPVLLTEERCCGHDLLWNGEVETFQRLVEANVQTFQEKGVKHILTTCAECCRTWRLDYPEEAPHYRPKVQHLAEFLAERLEQNQVAFEGNGIAQLTYQDPCRLGRHLGVFDAPRLVLDADALCCGTPGFVMCNAESRQLQTERLQSAAATGSDRLITACPKCLIHFSCAQAEDRRTGANATAIEVQDLTVLAASMLKEPETGEAQ